MTRYEFFVEGLPKGQPRARATSRGGFTRMYDPGTADEWKEAVAAAGAGVIPGVLQGAVGLQIEFYLPRPKKHYTKRGLRPDAPTWVTSKPDVDNATKAVMDALTDAGIWGDDAQVADLRVVKKYGDPTGAQVSIFEV